MDIDKLIEQLTQHDGIWCSVPTGENLIADASTALSTLQAENENLRADAVRFNELLASYQNVLVPELRTETEKLRVELEQVKSERDAAVDCCSGYCVSCRFMKDCAKHDMNDAAPMRWYYGDCEDWEWKVQKED